MLFNYPVSSFDFDQFLHSPEFNTLFDVFFCLYFVSRLAEWIYCWIGKNLTHSSLNLLHLGYLFIKEKILKKSK